MRWHDVSSWMVKIESGYYSMKLGFNWLHIGLNSFDISNTTIKVNVLPKTYLFYRLINTNQKGKT